MERSFVIPRLKNDDLDRLRAIYSDLPASPQQCPTCHGSKKYRTRTQPGTIIEVECECVDQWKLHRYLLYCGIDQHYMRMTWDDVRDVQQSAQKVALDYALHADLYVRRGIGLILHGKDKGTGKTLLATLLLKRLLSLGYDGYFTQFNEMLDAFQGTWKGGREEREWFQRRVQNTAVLIVDDVGREMKGRLPVAESMFDQVIRSRDAGDRVTILTTNLSLGELESGYSSNVMSLLLGRNVPHEVFGEDYRRAKLRERKVRDALDDVTYPVTLV